MGLEQLAVQSFITYGIKNYSMASTDLTSVVINFERDKTL